jgi:hypothetical protein
VSELRPGRGGPQNQTAARDGPRSDRRPELASWVYWGSAAGAIGLMLYLGWMA